MAGTLSTAPSVYLPVCLTVAFVYVCTQYFAVKWRRIMPIEFLNDKNAKKKLLNCLEMFNVFFIVLIRK